MTSTLAVWLHDLDPIFVSLGPLVIRWYGLSYLAGFVVGWAVVRWVARRTLTPLHPLAAVDLVFYVAIGTLLGGRVGYALFYDHDLLWGFRGALPFWDLLALNRGGMASHGGMIGMLTAAWLFARFRMSDHAPPPDAPASPPRDAHPQGDESPAPPREASKRPKRSASASRTTRAADAAEPDSPSTHAPSGTRVGVTSRCLHVCDYITLGAGPGVFFGRLANFINGELIGRPADHDFPLAVRFPTELLDWPRAAVEAGDIDAADRMDEVMRTFIEADVFGESLNLAQSRLDLYYDLSTRIIQAVRADDPQVRALIEPLLTPRHPSQLYAALGEGLLVFLVAAGFWRQPRKPGVVAGVTVMAYAVMRVANEFFRSPDAHIGLGLMGLSRGQHLSLVMFLAGLALWLIARGRTDSPALGGWGARNVR